MDVVTVSPRLVDFLIKQQKGVVWSEAKGRTAPNGAIQYATLGNRFVRRMMSEFVIKYKHDNWGNSGPARVAETIKLCKTTRDLHCDDVIIMPMKVSEIFEYQNVVWRFKSEDSNSWNLV